MEKFYCPEKINAIKSQLSLTKCEKIPKIERKGREKRREEGNGKCKYLSKKRKLIWEQKQEKFSENSALIGLKKLN